MRKISTLITAALLLLAVLAIAGFATPARAGAEETPLTGTETRHFGVPGRVWTAGSVTQVRDMPLTGTFAFSGEGVTLAGTETVVEMPRSLAMVGLPGESLPTPMRPPG